MNSCKLNFLFINTYRLKNTKYGTAEDYLIKTVGRIINEDIAGFRSRQELEILFMNSNHLCKTLLSKKSKEQDEDVFDSLKQFIIKYSAPDFSSRPLMKNLYKYLLEIYRKLNLKNSMASTFQKIEDIKSQAGELEIAIEKRKRECIETKEDLIKKHEECKALLEDLGHVISSTEISNVRSAQIINSITNISATARIKLEKTQERVRNILGDCILLSTSVVYLGIFSMKKRIEFRKILRETLKSFHIHCSPEWTSEDPQIHCEIFKEICEENGIHKMMNTTEFEDNTDNLRAWYINIFDTNEMNENDDGVRIDRNKLFNLNPVFSESLFYLLFTPTTPVWFDSSGILSEFIKKVFAGNSYQTDLQDLKTSKEESKKVDLKNISDSQLSISHVDTEVTPKEDVVCLHDLNITVPAGSTPQHIKLLKSHWTPLMHKLGWFIITDLKDAKSQSKLKISNISLVNKKISIMDSGLSMFKTNLFANNFRFSLGDEYEAKWTLMLVEPDCFNIVNESKEITRNASVVSQVNYWITIKWCFMKHFPQKIKNEFGNEVNIN